MVVATYESYDKAEVAVKMLKHSGFDIKKLSIVGRDYYTDDQVIGYYNNGDRMKAWGRSGAFWGGIWGLLIGSAFFWVPGVGPLLVAGPLIGCIVGGVEGAVVVGGLSALGAGLVGLGMPKDNILKYETAIKAGKFLLLAHSTEAEAALATRVLGETDSESIRGHC